MRVLAKAAARDYNQQVRALKAVDEKGGVDTVVSVIQLGVAQRRDEPNIRRQVVNSSIRALNEIDSYDAIGMTPLFDAVGDAIELCQSVPDAGDKFVSFLIIATTDGEENESVKWRSTLGAKIQELQATDRWTFAFRVPKGKTRSLTALGVPEGNIAEWETTEAGFERAATLTTSAISGYYEARRSGSTATKSFFVTDLSKLKEVDLKKELVDISSEVRWFPVENATLDIQHFCQSVYGHYHPGIAFYPLTKKEKVVQGHKIVCLKNKLTGAVYTGSGVRQLLGLPASGNITLAPGVHGEYHVYVQSTSNNRKLELGWTIMIWPKVRRL
jgi:hypothetical protein